MRPGNIQSGAGQLKDATEKLSLAWQSVREVWKDKQAAEIEEEVIVPLLDEVANLLPAINEISSVMGAAVRSCEE
ncbi:hypothetical protein KOR42_42160 [Thalassoglobus neptunius]|uniref:Uncharacterized protein n=1 Tax=Thalassoglobus neptunius TaxID=1938619 RepID=A0A5C5WBU0_9PLAN|nr:hypothetical protein [Thalassoglobus neptunius]TWT47102.1 hypothetical protein KOR42_42160 [Thalassoglobus neptunius]